MTDIQVYTHQKNMTTSGHHDDGSKGISAYMNEPKKSAHRASINTRPYLLRTPAPQAHEPPKSYLVHGQIPSATAPL